MKVLLAIDDSPYSEAAVQTVLVQLAPKTTEVRVVHILELILLVPSMMPGPNLAPDFVAMRQEALAEAKALVGRVASQLKSAGFAVTTDVEEGEPRTRIVELAKEWGADLILLGSHGRKGLQRFLMGSVSDSVARHAHCSVQIVRRPNS